MSEYAIELKGVSYTYGKGTPFMKLAVDHVNLNIRRGIITGIIGHTGSGKSTLLQMMNGLLRPQEGTVLLDGKDVWEKPGKIREIAFRVGLVFQYPEYQLFEETVRKDVSYGPKNMGLSDAEIERRVKEALAFVGIGEELYDASPFDLSGGQKRRVAIAGVIAMEPEVLILDEPAAGLDPRGRAEIFGNIVNYKEKTGRTVIIVSHSMDDMARYAEETAVLCGGRAVMMDETKKVFSAGRETLEKLGLNVPQITLLMEKLAEMGLPVSKDVFTVEEAKRELLPLLKGGQSDA